MEYTFYLGMLLTACLLCFSQASDACTGFGAITKSGTILGKNRDYYYVPQTFGLEQPLPQFENWYDNSYHHTNQFYALTSAESVSMGVNQKGLSAIEEDIISTGHAENAAEYKTLQQQQGVPDGLVLYGVLQNFNTVDEMIPYLTKIFANAAPDFYQFADAKKVLTVEVANNPQHTFVYHILNKPNEYFTHTNTYVSPEFVNLNAQFLSNQKSLISSNNRLKTITNLVSQSSTRTIDEASGWMMSTGDEACKDNPSECMNNSLFRSDLQGAQAIDMSTPNNKIFGTVATMIVSNQGSFKSSTIYVMMIKSITTLSNNHQLIKYDVLNTSLEQLFNDSNPAFVEHEMIR